MAWGDTTAKGRGYPLRRRGRLAGGTAFCHRSLSPPGRLLRVAGVDPALLGDAAGAHAAVVTAHDADDVATAGVGDATVGVDGDAATAGLAGSPGQRTPTGERVREADGMEAHLRLRSEEVIEVQLPVRAGGGDDLTH